MFKLTCNRNHQQRLANTIITALVFLSVTFLMNASAWSESQALADDEVNDPFQQTPTPVDHEREAGAVSQSNRIFLPIVVDESSSEQPPTQLSASNHTPGHSGVSPEAPPSPDAHTFVADTGGWLDQFLARGDVPNGRLTFTIGIDAPVVKPEWVEADGLLKAAALIDLVDRKVIAPFALLTLQAHDVDFPTTEDPCPEIDYVYVNGQQLEDFRNLTPAKLTGLNQDWQTWSMALPVTMLKFPTVPGIGGPPAAVANEIAVEINAQHCSGIDWKTEIDWGAISLRPNLDFPVIFVHGWLGGDESVARPWHIFDEFAGFATADGIQNELIYLNKGIEPIEDTSLLLLNKVLNKIKEWNVEKVHLFAHSKGGLFSRRALRGNQYLAEKVASLITLGSPHHGNDFVPTFSADGLCDTYAPEAHAKCMAAAQEFTRQSIREQFNYTGCKLVTQYDSTSLMLTPSWINCQPRWEKEVWPNISYYTFVGGIGDVDPRSGTYPWSDPCRPEPCASHVDGRYFWHDHVSLAKDEAVYEDLIPLLASSAPPPNQARSTLAVLLAR